MGTQPQDDLFFQDIHLEIMDEALSFKKSPFGVDPAGPPSFPFRYVDALMARLADMVEMAFDHFVVVTQTLSPQGKRAMRFVDFSSGVERPVAMWMPFMGGDYAVVNTLKGEKPSFDIVSENRIAALKGSAHSDLFALGINEYSCGVKVLFEHVAHCVDDLVYVKAFADARASFAQKSKDRALEKRVIDLMVRIGETAGDRDRKAIGRTNILCGPKAYKYHFGLFPGRTVFQLTNVQTDKVALTIVCDSIDNGRRVRVSEARYDGFRILPAGVIADFWKTGAKTDAERNVASRAAVLQYAGGKLPSVVLGA